MDLNDLIHAKPLEQCLSHSKCTTNVSHDEVDDDGGEIPGGRIPGHRFCHSLINCPPELSIRAEMNIFQKH